MGVSVAIGASLVAGIAATAWTSLTLAEFGNYVAIVPMLAFPTAAVLTFALLSRGRTGGESRGLALPDLLAVVIACATLMLTVPPDEILVGGQDPGVYVHVASSVARTGSLVMDEPDLVALTREERELVTRTNLGYTEPFPGMWLYPDGRLYPQFYHLYPCLMAVAWSIGGIRGALLVNPLLNVAAIVALYALASLLIGRRWALAATLVQALGTAQIRQAKFPTAEMMAQFFLIAGVALLAAAMQEDSPPPVLAPLAGASLGMATLTRYDTIVFLVPLVAVLLVGMESARRTRTVLAALGTMTIFVIQSWLHQRYVTPFYQPLGGMVGRFLLVAGALVLLLLAVRRGRLWQQFSTAILRRETAIRTTAALVVVAWVLFGWFIRPRLAGQGRIGHIFRRLVGEPAVSRVSELFSGVESANMLYLVDLLGAGGLLAALAGVTVLIVTRRRLWETAWLTASVCVLMVITLNVFHDHFLMWVSRRFVPVVLPLASIGIAAAAAFLANARRGRSPGLAGAGIVLVAAVLWLNAGATRAMASEREWPGLIAWYERLEAALPAQAELYCDQPGFAAPVRFISGRRAYELPARTTDRIAMLVEMMRRKAAAGREVLFLSQQSFADPRARGLVPIGTYPLRSSMLATSRRGIPTGTKARGADFVLYRVQPS